MSVEVDVYEVCTTMPIPTFGDRGVPEGLQVDVSLAELAALAGEPFADLETRYELRSAGFVANSNIESLDFLDRLAIELGPGDRGLPTLSLMDRSFDVGAEPVVVSDYAPTIDVTGYVAGDSSLRVAVAGDWQNQEWGADLDLCFSISAGYEL